MNMAAHIEHVDITIEEADGLTTVTIAGERGSGKTSVARAMSDYFESVKSYRVVWMISMHDSYDGQEVVIADADDIHCGHMVPQDFVRRLGSRYSAAPKATPQVLIVPETR